MQSWQDRRESKHVELTPGDSQTIQVPADGFRDGNMGDDKPLDSAEESLQIDILPRTPLCASLCPDLPANPSLLETYASSLLPLPSLQSLTNPRIETKNTWHRPDPSFTYLLSFFMLLTGIAWGIAYTTSVSATVRLTILFVFVHFLAVSLLVAAAAFFLVGRLLGPGIAGLPGRRRQQGLFTQAGEGEQLEFGYCFDVSGGTSCGDLRMGQADSGDVTGRYTSVLSGLGMVVRYAIHSLAVDSEGQLVSIGAQCI